MKFVSSAPSKMIAGLLTFQLLIPSSLFSNVMSTQPAISVHPILTYAIPDTMGRIMETHVHSGVKAPTVVFIQDAHVNYDAQKNISLLLNEIIKNYGTMPVAVEGAEGTMDTSLFRAFPIEKVKENVFNRALRQGLITGPEFLSITGDVPFDLFGVDDRNLYSKNMRRMLSIMEFQESGKNYVRTLKQTLSNLKAIIYNDEQRALDSLFSGFEDGKIDFDSFLDAFQKFSENVTPKTHRPNLTKIIAMREKIKNANTDSKIADSKEFLKEIRTEDLFEEITEAGRTIRLGLARTNQEKEFVEVSDFLNLLEKGLEFRLTREDMGFFRKYTRKYTGDRIHALLLSALSEHKISPRVLKDDAMAFDISNLAGQLVDFYRIAEKRDRIFVKSLLNEMETQGKDLGVLVTGGYHREGITKEFKKKGISYVVISPAMEKLGEHGDYLGLMKLYGTFLTRSGEARSGKSDTLALPSNLPKNPMLPQAAERNVRGLLGELLRESKAGGYRPFDSAEGLIQAWSSAPDVALRPVGPNDVFALTQSGQASIFSSIGKQNPTLNSLLSELDHEGVRFGLQHDMKPNEAYARYLADRESPDTALPKINSIPETEVAVPVGFGAMRDYTRALKNIGMFAASVAAGIACPGCGILGQSQNPPIVQPPSEETLVALTFDSTGALITKGMSETSPDTEHTVVLDGELFRPNQQFYVIEWAASKVTVFKIAGQLLQQGYYAIDYRVTNDTLILTLRSDQQIQTVTLQLDEDMTDELDSWGIDYRVLEDQRVNDQSTNVIPGPALTPSSDLTTEDVTPLDFFIVGGQAIAFDDRSLGGISIAQATETGRGVLLNLSVDSRLNRAGTRNLFAGGGLQASGGRPEDISTAPYVIELDIRQGLEYLQAGKLRLKLEFNSTALNGTQQRAVRYIEGLRQGSNIVAFEQEDLDRLVAQGLDLTDVSNIFVIAEASPNAADQIMSVELQMNIHPVQAKGPAIPSNDLNLVFDATGALVTTGASETSPDTERTVVLEGELFRPNQQFYVIEWATGKVTVFKIAGQLLQQGYYAIDYRVTNDMLILTIRSDQQIQTITLQLDENMTDELSRWGMIHRVLTDQEVDDRSEDLIPGSPIVPSSDLTSADISDLDLAYNNSSHVTFAADGSSAEFAQITTRGAEFKFSIDPRVILTPHTRHLWAGGGHQFPGTPALVEHTRNIDQYASFVFGLDIIRGAEHLDKVRIKMEFIDYNGNSGVVYLDNLLSGENIMALNQAAKDRLKAQGVDLTHVRNIFAIAEIPYDPSGEIIEAELAVNHAPSGFGAARVRRLVSNAFKMALGGAVMLTAALAPIARAQAEENERLKLLAQNEGLDLNFDENGALIVEGVSKTSPDTEHVVTRDGHQFYVWQPVTDKVTVFKLLRPSIKGGRIPIKDFHVTNQALIIEMWNRSNVVTHTIPFDENLIDSLAQFPYGVASQLLEDQLVNDQSINVIPGPALTPSGDLTTKDITHLDFFSVGGSAIAFDDRGLGGTSIAEAKEAGRGVRLDLSVNPRVNIGTRNLFAGGGLQVDWERPEDISNAPYVIELDVRQGIGYLQGNLRLKLEFNSMAPDGSQNRAVRYITGLNQGSNIIAFQQEDLDRLIAQGLDLTRVFNIFAIAEASPNAEGQVMSVQIQMNILPAEAGNVIIVNPGDSIQAAIDRAHEGDTIFIKSGIYSIPEFPDGILRFKPGLKIIGEDRNSTVITAKYYQNADKIDFENIALSFYPAGGIFGNNMSFKNVHFGGFYPGLPVYIIGNKNIISDSEVQSVALGLSGNQNIVRRTLIVPFPWYGPRGGTIDGALRIRGNENFIDQTTVVAQGASVNAIGIQIETGASFNQIRNSIIYASAEEFAEGLGAFGPNLQGNSIDYSLVYVKGGRAIPVTDAYGISSGENMLFSDPLFVAPNQYPPDFHLAPNSPAIGAANDGGDLGAFPSGFGIEQVPEKKKLSPADLMRLDAMSELMADDLLSIAQMSDRPEIVKLVSEVLHATNDVGQALEAIESQKKKLLGRISDINAGTFRSVVISGEPGLSLFKKGLKENKTDLPALIGQALDYVVVFLDGITEQESARVKDELEKLLPRRKTLILVNPNAETINELTQISYAQLIGEITDIMDRTMDPWVILSLQGNTELEQILYNLTLLDKMRSAIGAAA